MMMMMMTGCPHCTRPTDLGGLHSDDDYDDDYRGVHIVLDQQIWVVDIVMMMMIMMTEVSTLY
jgi:hypothetical protein